MVVITPDWVIVVVIICPLAPVTVVVIVVGGPTTVVVESDTAVVVDVLVVVLVTVVVEPEVGGGTFSSVKATMSPGVVPGQVTTASKLQVPIGKTTYSCPLTDAPIDGSTSIGAPM